MGRRVMSWEIIKTLLVITALIAIGTAIPYVMTFSVRWVLVP